jgi:putative ABC transport system permease protein
MAIPISYNIRNLRLRMGTSVMTALGIGLTAAVARLIMALLNGLHQVFTSSGDPLNVIVLRKGAQTELQSSVTREAFQTVKVLPGIAKGTDGNPLVSGELVVVIVLPQADGTGEGNVNVRGMSAAGLQLRPGVKLVGGRWFTSGQHEVTVSRSVRDCFQTTGECQNLHFGEQPWRIVGVFDAGQTAFGSGIWTDVDQMFADFNRDTFTSVLAHATDPIAAEGLKNRMSSDQRLRLDGKLEPAYYGEQTKAGHLFNW